MADKKSLLSRLTDTIIGVGGGSMSNPPEDDLSMINGIPVSTPVVNQKDADEVLYTFDNKEERDAKLLQLRQNKLLSYQWRKVSYDSSVEQMLGATQVRVMYRDADLMDQWPEINAGLYIISEEATTLKDGKMLNVYSQSKRIQAILQDLFYNRLDVNILLPMIVRAVAKYGNEFMFLNISTDNGVLGWKELPVYEMKRIEEGMINGYGGSMFNATVGEMKPGEVKFVWEGRNIQTPYQSWQIAHFRLIQNSLFLPYGVSQLNGARRAWRMLSMMEDAMLLYRLERSVERRIFKVNIGMIDDTDTEAFLQQYMNRIKRAPIIDPKTGQIDLRKNFLDVGADYIIPIRDGMDGSSIETLQSANNPTSMDDIKYMEEKVLAMLRVPKQFLNFSDSQGKQQNLSLVDIRFNRMINTIQQAIIMELNKIAIIHLYLLGFEDDLTNFTLTLNNPSNQIEMMELDNLNKRIAAASSALAEQGGGIPLYSWHLVQREIMGRTDDEISKILNEIRLEIAMAEELKQTPSVISKTGMFDKVDRLYGNMLQQGQQQQQEGGSDDGGFGGGIGGGGPIGGGGGMPSMGGGLGDLGEPGAPEEGMIGGEEGEMDMGDMGETPDMEIPNENVNQLNGRDVLLENDKTARQYVFFDTYLKNVLQEDIKKSEIDKMNQNLIKANEKLEKSLENIEKIENEENN